MKSSIKIDFADLNGNGIEPIIRVNSIPSDDPRDSLIKTLFQGIGSYLQIQFTNTAYSVTKDNLPETENTIILRRPTNPNLVDSPFFSRFNIGDEVDYCTSEGRDRAFKEAQKDSPDVSPADLEYIPEYLYGSIVSVTFTKAKVYYDIVDDYSGEIAAKIESDHVKKLSEKYSNRPIIKSVSGTI